MRSTLRNKKPRLGFWLPMVAAAGLLIVATGPAHASLVLAAQPTTATAGSTDNTFDVTLTNDGPDSVAIGAFSFGLTVTSSDVVFTSVTTDTVAAYIFGPSSVFGPIISTTPPPPGQSVMASDYTFDLAGFTLNAGDTVGLGHVLFDVPSTAANSVVPVILTPFPTTGLSDPDGVTPIPATLQDGQITITGGSGVVPEPATLIIWSFLGLLGVFAVPRWRKGAA